MNIYSNSLILAERRSNSVTTNSTPTHHKQKGIKSKEVSHKMGKKAKSLSPIPRDDGEEFDKEDEHSSSTSSTQKLSSSRRDEDLKSNVEIAKQVKDVQRDNRYCKTPQETEKSADVDANVKLNDFTPLLLKNDLKETIFQTNYHELADKNNQDSPSLAAVSHSSGIENKNGKKQQTEVENVPEFPVLDLTNPPRSMNREDESNEAFHSPLYMKETVVSRVTNKDVLEDNYPNKSNTSFEHPPTSQQEASSGHFQTGLDQNKKQKLLAKLTEIDKNYNPFSGSSTSAYSVRSREKLVVSGTASANQPTFLPSVQRSNSRRLSEGSATDISFGSYKPSFGFGTAFLSKPSSSIVSTDKSSDHLRNKKKAELMASLFSTESKIQPATHPTELSNKIKEHSFDDGYDKNLDDKRFNPTQYFKGHFSTGSSLSVPVLSVPPDTETKNFGKQLQASPISHSFKNTQHWNQNSDFLSSSKHLSLNHRTNISRISPNTEGLEELLM
ncbi:uncharacterized protein LOC106475241 [Limulus polyphemus]|uniref:Uncharacterized protein LOC106475241 n=1 Tax=Limulus polyphemus TaxID=6850 RepID=A0ABM1RUR0_LIMPO|nr:uncharacterized protein LOC106475241 [Limulus polyphemus]